MGHRQQVERLVRENGWSPLGQLATELNSCPGQRIVDFSVIDHAGYESVAEIIDSFGMIGQENRLKATNLIDRWGDYWELAFDDGSALLLTHTAQRELYGRLDHSRNHLRELCNAEAFSKSYVIYSVVKHPHLAGDQAKALIGQQIRTLALLELCWPDTFEDLSKAAPEIFPEPTLSRTLGITAWGAIELGLSSGQVVCLGPGLFEIPEVLFSSDFVSDASALDASMVVERRVIHAV